MSYAPVSYSSGDAPLSAKEISDRALDFDYNTEIPLRYWLRTTATLQREAEIYTREGNDEQAYLLLLRHANLLIERLPIHPEAKQPEYSKFIKQLVKGIPAILAKLEELKPRINNRYKAYQAEVEVQRHRQSLKDADYHHFQQQQQQQQLLVDQDYFQSSSRRPGSLSSRSRTASSIASSRDYGDDGTYSSSRPKLRSDGSERTSRRSGGLPPALTPGTSTSSKPSYSAQKHFEEHGWSYEPDSSTALVSSTTEKRSSRQMREEELDLQKSLRALHMQSDHPLPPSLQMGLQESARRPSVVYSSRRPSYPSIPKRGPAIEDYDPYNADAASARFRPERAPTLPPKIRNSTIDGYDDSYTAPRAAPSRPSKISTSPPPVLHPKAVPDVPTIASVSNYQFQPVAYTEGGQALRTIFLPESVRTKFLQVAGPNTRRNLETCGILCGFLKQNALFINRLVIPDQEATSDTCATTDEEALFNYVDGEDLLVLGWIHTHPTQTCFMSSVDLHTHCSYQLMMAESIAIVCAPSQDPSWGIFRLTDPSGVKTISSCRQKGLFHPHSGGDVYTDALRPGHVCEVKDMGFGVVDLRPPHRR